MDRWIDLAGPNPNPHAHRPCPSLTLTLTTSQAERDAWTAAIMENCHQPPCPGNLLASLLTYQFHQVRRYCTPP